jgi:hypothetical protein
MLARLLQITILCIAQIHAQDAFSGIQRVVAIGDVHGGHTEFVKVLEQAGLIDSKQNWIGGATHLVQLGDVLDRGDDSRKSLDLIASLESQARKARGRVHSLLGNHEVMNMLGDLRYVSSGEFKAFQTANSSELRAKAYETLADPGRKNDPAYRMQWEKDHPLGWVEHRQAFAPDGKYGKAFLGRRAIVKINDTLYLHAGLSAKYANMPMDEMNVRTRQELKELTTDGFLMDPNGPFWYRGMATDPEEKLAQHITLVLQRYGVKRIVLGHTPTQGAVLPRFEGRVILADVGLAAVYNGSLACLVIEEGKAFALHRGTRLEIPTTAGDLPAYLKAAAELDPPGSKLRKFVEQLQPR